MANPQAENGHTKIPNDIVEALAKIRLSGEEMQVLWVILRKTYGWHKKQDAISLSQFSEMTGLSRQHAQRAIKKLLPKMVIVVTKNGNSQTNVYEFNEEFVNWKVLPKKGTVSNNGYKSVTKNGAYKRKERKQHSDESLSEKTKPKRTRPPREYTISFDKEQNKFQGIYLEQVKGWEKLFNLVEVVDELKIHMPAWITANWHNGKGQKKDWEKFIIGWLSRQQRTAKERRAA